MAFSALRPPRFFIDDLNAEFATGIYDVPSVAVDDVVEQSPLVGQALRTTTVGERLREPPSAEARNFAIANRFEVLRAMQELADDDVFVDDVPVPGIPFDASGDPLGLVGALPQRAPLDFSVLTAVPNYQALLLADAEPAVANDEAAYFNIAVEIVDHTVTLLRNLERRVHTYKGALARARRVLATLKALRSSATARLAALDSELAEARHDVEVARSLAEEEERRIDDLNARRQQIVRDEVRFLAFRRVRTVDLLDSAERQPPARPLEPALAEDPVVACLVSPVEVPAELRAMIELFREAPLRWFRRLPRLLDQLDRPDVLFGALSSSRLRAERLTANVAAVSASTLSVAANTATASPVAAVASAQEASPAVAVQTSFAATAEVTAFNLAATTTSTTLAVRGNLGQSLQRTLGASRQLLAENRAGVARLDLAPLKNLSWLDTRREAEKHVALGDLLDAGLGRPAVVQRAARELDEIARLGTCLYAGFGEVPASIRLDWAERLSQFDRPVDLADLSRLPRWREIDFTERRELQGLVDGVYKRLDRRRKGVLALAHDLVRVCILLASHAPVDRLVSGEVEEPTTVKTGGQVKVRVQPLEPVRIGMPVMFYAADRTAARGVVENLAGGLATTRVVEAFVDNVQLAAGARVEFAETRAFERRGLGSQVKRRTRRRRFSEVL